MEITFLSFPISFSLSLPIVVEPLGQECTVLWFDPFMTQVVQKNARAERVQKSECQTKSFILKLYLYINHCELMFNTGFTLLSETANIGLFAVNYLSL